MRKSFLITVLVALLAAGTAWAQDDELKLNVRRVFGYGAGSQIQGIFRLTATGPAELQSVTFTIDGETLNSDSEAPFQTQFVTDDHPLGWHELGATGITAGGQTLTATPRRFEFVPASRAFEMIGAIVIPLLVVIGLVMAISIGGPLLFGRKRQPLPAGAERRYGVFGGTICPKCGRPFARHLWALNLPGGKLDRCDNCGRWSLTRAMPLDVLRRAEAAELEAERAGQAGSVPAMSEAERRRRALEESRFVE
jgi:hypothetical protein